MRVDDVARAAVRRGSAPAPAAAPSPAPRAGDELVAELAREVGASRAPALAQRLRNAGRDFERERFREARGALKEIAERAPGAPTVRELYGLTLYRLGDWRGATRELEAFVAITGSTEQHPILADAARALGRYPRVEELWAELGEASPRADVVAEGRIVAAGALADQGRVAEAIARLEPAARRTPARPKPYHLRIWYALADLRERAGDVPAARSLFERVARTDPGFADVAERLSALGRG